MPYKYESHSKQKTVLLIEDSPTQALETQSILEKQDLNVICAINGEMGLRLAYQVVPDVIILDVQMPGINGFEVCERLKKDPETASIPVIMFTHQDTQEGFRHGIGAGACDYIPKDAFAIAVLQGTLHKMGIIRNNPFPHVTLI